MNDFSLGKMPEFIFGHKAEERCAELIKRYGGTRVLIHHSGEPFVRPLIDKVRGILEGEGLFCIDLGGVVPNPRLELVYEGIELCRKNQIDAVLAVGGGSVIDSSKGIALGAVYDGDVWDFYLQKAIPTKRLPLGCISTFAGTGSESTRASVVTKSDEKLKRSADDIDIIRPDFAIMNPELTFTVPPYQSASGISDITSHLLENYFSRTKHVDFSDNLTFGALKTVLKNGPLVMQEPHNYDARAEIMISAPFAINGIIRFGRSGDWSCHLIEHEMSAEWDIAHGAGLAVITPVWMRYVYEEDIPLFAKLGVNVFGLSYDFDNPKATAEETIRRFENFFRSLGMPSRIREFNVGEVSQETYHKMARRIPYYRDNGTRIGVIKPLDEQDIVKIYQLAY